MIMNKCPLFTLLPNQTLSVVNGGLLLLRTTMNNKVNKVIETVKRYFDKNSHSWSDYSKAKTLFESDFTHEEYDYLIKFISDYLGV